jgi:hypothetical protein
VGRDALRPDDIAESFYIGSIPEDQHSCSDLLTPMSLFNGRNVMTGLGQRTRLFLGVLLSTQGILALPTYPALLPNGVKYASSALPDLQRLPLARANGRAFQPGLLVPVAK